MHQHLHGAPPPASHVVVVERVDAGAQGLHLGWGQQVGAALCQRQVGQVGGGRQRDGCAVVASQTHQAG